jgi:hypothetical protein
MPSSDPIQPKPVPYIFNSYRLQRDGQRHATFRYEHLQVPTTALALTQLTLGSLPKSLRYLFRLLWSSPRHVQT